MTNKKIAQALLFALFLLVLGTAPSLAVTIPVNMAADVIDPADGKCALREAVIAANEDISSGSVSGECPAGDGTDTITLGPGIYPLTIRGAREDNGYTGDLDIKNPVTLTCGGGAENCTIFGNTLDRVLYINGSAGNVAITGLTIKGGYAEVYPYGGGIYNAAVLTLSGVSVSGNTALNSGGGVYNVGTPHLVNSSVTSNLASEEGGGIFSNGFLDIDHSVIQSNQAYDSYGQGGCIYVDNGALTIAGSSILSDNAADSGGGIYLFSAPSSTITSSTLANNTAGDDGGGIYHREGNLSLRNVTFSGNIATSVGGGVVTIYTDLLSLNQVTLSNNSAGGGDGIWIANVSTDVTTANTIFTDPCEGGIATIASLGGNMESPGNTCTFRVSLTGSTSRGCNWRLAPCGIMADLP